MRIAIIASHAWSIPNIARTGDVWVLDLARGLNALGHDVTLFAPEGTMFSRVRATGSANGKFAPNALEHATYAAHRVELHASFDIVHDVSTSKVVGHRLAAFGTPVCMTLTGGPWYDAISPKNLCVFSASQRERVSRGATDYEGSPTPDIGGPAGYPAPSHVVPAGIDTDFYRPSNYDKDDWCLWLNRWHPAKGYALAIRIAKETGLPLVMAGVHPDNTTNAHEHDCALEARELARDAPSIDFRWLAGTDPEHDREKRALYRRARCLLYTVQFQEPFGLSMVEALACGTPVVGSRMGNVPELLELGVTGVVCNLDAGVVSSFWAGAELARTMVPQDCRTAAETQYSREAMATRYVAEYMRIIAGERW